jgi:hypothetical protein
MINDEFYKFIIYHSSFIIYHSSLLTHFYQGLNPVTAVCERREGDKNRNKSEYIPKTIDFQYFREKRCLKQNHNCLSNLLRLEGQIFFLPSICLPYWLSELGFMRF